MRTPYVTSLVLRIGCKQAESGRRFSATHISKRWHIAFWPVSSAPQLERPALAGTGKSKSWKVPSKNVRSVKIRRKAVTRVLTPIPRENGKCVTWDVTVTDTLALSFTLISSGGAAKAAAERKTSKQRIYHAYIFSGRSKLRSAGTDVYFRDESKCNPSNIET